MTLRSILLILKSCQNRMIYTVAVATDFASFA